MKRTRRKLLTLASALVALVAINPAAARQQDPPKQGAHGGFQMSVHAHSSETDGPSGAETLFETDPLPAPVPEGTTDFSYSAIPCSKQAPFNDTALNFNPNPYPIPDPAPVRFLIEGTVIDGETGTVEGTITTILCQESEESEHTFITEFQGRYRQVSDNELRFTGTYRIVRGTGMFEDLTGQGSIKGSFTCLDPILERERAENCEDLGFFSDFVARLRGSFTDPTIPSS
ncbi:MAG: hypothetical protein M3O70_02670 [Actinomycetota bacterium]|nr:hypothetical protein [Actinomycetota bacterium]